MSTLLLRLAAPLQAWGMESKFDARQTWREPSKALCLAWLRALWGYAGTIRKAFAGWSR